MSNQVYICDPKLNTECSKSNCIHNPLVVDPKCYCTKNIDFAKKPIEKLVLQLPVDETTAMLFDIKVENKDE